MGGYAPVKGKCLYWREMLNAEDEWDTRLKPAQRRVECSCFVEGDRWEFTVADVPLDCPEKRQCRYYIKSD